MSWPLRSTIICLALLAACASAGSLEETAVYVRKLTYPPDFEYISAQQLEGSMHALAAHISDLDEIMWAAEPVQAEGHERILEILSGMRVEARKLDRGQPTNHPRVDRYLPWLQADIDKALEGARAIPPNYYYAGAISGSCEYCHVPRKPHAPRPDSERNTK